MNASLRSTTESVGGVHERAAGRSRRPLGRGWLWQALFGSGSSPLRGASGQPTAPSGRDGAAGFADTQATWWPV